MHARKNADAAACLYVVSTPIGNLQDITMRALDVLRSVGTILCEDTRTSTVLLRHHGVHTPLAAYHDHNEQVMAPRLLEQLQAGQSLALISDAGTPLMADPGYRLVRLCHEHGIAVRSVPGASAVSAALATSGLPPLPFLFAGFLPARSGQRQKVFNGYARLEATLVFFESARRLTASLSDAQQILGNRLGAVGRELTKTFEETRRAPLSELAAWYDAHPPKGEIVLLVAGCDKSDTDAAGWQSALQQSLQETTIREAAAGIALSYGLPRRLVYQEALRIKSLADQVGGSAARE